MNVPPSTPPGSPAAWLARARAALVLARQDAEGVAREDLCFQAQQAAEKALKAVCLAHRIEFPFTHDIRYLMRLLAEQGLVPPTDLRPAAILSDYAVATRYPGTTEPVTFEEYGEALNLAERILAWCEDQIR